MVYVKNNLNYNGLISYHPQYITLGYFSFKRGVMAYFLVFTLILRLTGEYAIAISA
jgi:hypothetical protein